MHNAERGGSLSAPNLGDSRMEMTNQSKAPRSVGCESRLASVARITGGRRLTTEKCPR